jgi:hypothetical protein
MPNSLIPGHRLLTTETVRACIEKRRALGAAQERALRGMGQSFRKKIKKTACLRLSATL